MRSTCSGKNKELIILPYRPTSILIRPSWSCTPRFRAAESKTPLRACILLENPLLPSFSRFAVRLCSAFCRPSSLVFSVRLRTLQFLCKSDFSLSSPRQSHRTGHTNRVNPLFLCRYYSFSSSFPEGAERVCSSVRCSKVTESLLRPCRNNTTLSTAIETLLSLS